MVRITTISGWDLCCRVGTGGWMARRQMVQLEYASEIVLIIWLEADT